MPERQLKTVKRFAASMSRYCGHISRSLNQGLSSTSLVKSLVTLRIAFAGRSLMFFFQSSERPVAFGAVFARDRICQAKENKSARIIPHASSHWPCRTVTGTAASASGVFGTTTPDSLRISLASGELGPAATMH